MKHNLIRVCVSLENTLVDTFDSIATQDGHASRSEGIREAMRLYIQHIEQMDVADGRLVGVISMTFDPGNSAVIASLDRIQLSYRHLIRTCFNLYTAENSSVRVLVLDGDGKSIRTLVEKSMAQKGVMHVRLATFYHEPEITAA